MTKLKSPVVIIGLGKSGTAAAELLKLEGYTPLQDLFLFDENKDSDFKSWEDLNKLSPGTVIVSPGVPLQSVYLKKLFASGWIITSEINLASLYLTDEKIVGITGSVAKSTVTSLLGLAARHDDEHTFVGGNLGVPFCEYAILVKKGHRRAKWIILELSSYQLENCKNLKLENSALTYLSANHLERYSSVEQYYKTKCDIGVLTKNICVINSASEDNLKFSNLILCQKIFTSAKDFTDQNLLNSIQLMGQHNKDNFCVAYELAKVCGLSESAIMAMTKFRGLEHRIEYVATKNGVIYINDSKATAMDSVLVAVQAAKEKVLENNNLYLLLGGKDKNLPWQDLSLLNADKKIEIVFFGQCGELAKIKMQNISGIYFSKLDSALNAVIQKAKPGDVVLLSPGGTSLDEFKKFEDRGNFFKNKVLAL